MERILTSKPRLQSTLRRLPQYAELFMALTWRNLRLQYQNWALGLFWGVISPLLMASIFYIALNRRVGLDFDYYFLYIYTGFIFWNAFGGGLSQAYLSFLQYHELVKKIYFPRLLLPLTFLAAKLVDFSIGLAILLVCLILSPVAIDPLRFLGFTFLALWALVCTASGIYWMFSVLCVRFRGFQVVFPFVQQALFFTAPVIYDPALSIENPLARAFFQANPVSGIFYLFRAGVFAEPVDLGLVLGYVGYALAIGGLGLLWFHREDRHLADRL